MERKRSGPYEKREKNSRTDGRPDFRRPAPPREDRAVDRISEDLHWGRQIVVKLLKESPDKVQKVYLGKNVTDRFSMQIGELAEKGRVVVQRVAPEVLTEMCGGGEHQGVACRSGISMIGLEDLLARLSDGAGPVLLVLLDHIQDPHNLGSVARTAEGCGASAVIFPKRRSALPGATVVKVSAGAALRVPMVAVNNVSQTIMELQRNGFWTIGLDNNSGRSIWSEPMPERTVLVAGSEGEGLSRLVGETCDEIVRIPLSGSTGSLNAGVACGVAMFEWARKWRRQD